MQNVVAHGVFAPAAFFGKDEATRGAMVVLQVRVDHGFCSLCARMMPLRCYRFDLVWTSWWCGGAMLHSSSKVVKLLPWLLQLRS